MRHRHLDVPPDTPAAELGLAAIDDLLDRGDLDDWAPLLAEVRRDPRGPVSDRILQLVDRHRMYGTSELWRAWIHDLREAASSPHVGSALRNLRRTRGLTQRELAARMEMSQPEVSRLESRRDVRLSTLRAYVAATDSELLLVARTPDGDVALVTSE